MCTYKVGKLTLHEQHSDWSSFTIGPGTGIMRQQKLNSQSLQDRTRIDMRSRGGRRVLATGNHLYSNAQ